MAPKNGVSALMKFFVLVQDAKIAEESYQALKNFIEKQGIRSSDASG